MAIKRYSTPFSWCKVIPLAQMEHVYPAGDGIFQGMEVSGEGKFQARDPVVHGINRRHLQQY